jgi:transporter family protein
MTWVLLAFVSSLCLGFYDISKKIALRDNSVVDVLTASIVISSAILAFPLLLSRIAPEIAADSFYYVPQLDLRGHLLTIVKSGIVLSSWICAYLALKHLPISVVSPWQATRPMWTLIGALLIFGERLNGWQWVGVTLAIGSIFAFSIGQHRRNKLSKNKQDKRYYIALALAILIGAASGLYDKYMMRQFHHNAVQVYYTCYQAIMMLIVWTIDRYAKRRRTMDNGQWTIDQRPMTIIPIVLISVFLVISDNVYMLALQDPDSMIAVVSTIRRGGTVIGFAYGLIFLKEPDPWKKILAMCGILAGLVCLAIGT